MKDSGKNALCRTCGVVSHVPDEKWKFCPYCAAEYGLQEGIAEWFVKQRKESDAVHQEHARRDKRIWKWNLYVYIVIAAVGLLSWLVTQDPKAWKLAIGCALLHLVSRGRPVHWVMAMYYHHKNNKNKLAQKKKTM